MSVSALDENGKPVDWWIIYKVPHLGAGAGTDEDTGYEYVYYDATIDANPDPRTRNVVKSPNVLNEGKGALNLTLDSVFKYFKKPPATTGWILYNDEMPASATCLGAARILKSRGPRLDQENTAPELGGSSKGEAVCQEGTQESPGFGIAAGVRRSPDPIEETQTQHSTLVA